MNQMEFEQYVQLVRQRAQLDAEILILEKRQQLLATAPPREWLTDEQVIEMLGMDIVPRTLRHWVSQQQFPPPCTMTRRWATDHVQGWINADDKYDYCEKFFN